MLHGFRFGLTER